MRTETILTGLCDALQANCGDEYEACREVGVSLIFLDQWRKDDKKVNERVQEAIRVGRMGLVSAAIKRGVHGVQEGIYYKGEWIADKTVYSDSLLTTLLKAQVPEFAKDAEGAGTQVTVNVANIMPRADSYKQWLEMKQQTLAGPAKDAVIEGVVVEVPDEREKSLEALGRIMGEPAPVLANVL